MGHLRAPSVLILWKVTLYGRAPEQGRMVLDRWQPPKWCHVCYLLSPLACPASLSQDWLYPHLCLFTFFIISSSLPSCKVISCIYQSCCMESYPARALRALGLLLADGVPTVRNVYFVQYFFARNRTSSDLSYNLSFGIVIKNRIHFWLDPMFKPRPGKIMQRKKYPFPK